MKGSAYTAYLRIYTVVKDIQRLSVFSLIRCLLMTQKYCSLQNWPKSDPKNNQFTKLVSKSEMHWFPYLNSAQSVIALVVFGVKFGSTLPCTVNGCQLLRSGEFS